MTNKTTNKNMKTMNTLLLAGAVATEAAFQNRRRFLRQLGFTGAGLLAATLAGCNKSDSGSNAVTSSPVSSDSGPILPVKGYPAPRNAEFNPGWRLTSEKEAGTYNNFYEFSLAKDAYRYVGKFVTSPWPLEITGPVEKPMTLDAMELAEMFGLEERVYRFRCVEAWVMIVPRTGFQLSKLIERVVPKPEAKFIRFEAFNRPEQAPGIAKAPQYPWPYHEGLRLDEAMNLLTLLATGIYGKPLPKQHGAPIRLVTPWKYGYKSRCSEVGVGVGVGFVAKAMRPDPSFCTEPLASLIQFKSRLHRWSLLLRFSSEQGERPLLILHCFTKPARFRLYRGQHLELVGLLVLEHFTRPPRG